MLPTNDKLNRINHLNKEIHTIIEKLKKIDRESDTSTLNNAIIDLDQLYSEFFQLEKEGYYTETQFSTYKELKQVSRELYTSFGDNHPWYVQSYENLQNYCIKEDLNNLQIKNMENRLTTGGRNLENPN
ncbi:hypothetical protein bcgnr5372_26570 [Bacillus luti]|nr:hypothetical protein [Bacillus cereus]HDR8331362.1 hypothetical protein [Bacillus cereus]HDR8335948.1 hypothetical protein [Bacillus cereus]